MPDYKAMYLKLFDTVIKTIDELQKQIIETEEIYISENNDNNIIELKNILNIEK